MQVAKAGEIHQSYQAHFENAGNRQWLLNMLDVEAAAATAKAKEEEEAKEAAAMGAKGAAAAKGAEEAAASKEAEGAPTKAAAEAVAKGAAAAVASGATAAVASGAAAAVASGATAVASGATAAVASEATAAVASGATEVASGATADQLEVRRLVRAVLSGTSWDDLTIHIVRQRVEASMGRPVVQYKELISHEMICHMHEVEGQQQHAVEVPSEQQQQLAKQTAPEQQIEGRPNSKEKSQLNQHVANPDVFAEEGAEEGAEEAAASKAEERAEEAAERAAAVEASAEAARATRGLMFEKMFSVVPTLGKGTWRLKHVEQALAADRAKPRCKLKRLLVCNGNDHLCRGPEWEGRGWQVTNPKEAYAQLNHKKYRLVGVDTEGLQGRKGCTPPPQWGMAMVQLATPDAMLIEIVWDEETKMLKPSAQLQELLRDEHSIKVTWGLEFSETWPEFEMLQGIANIQQTRRQVCVAQGGDVPASLTDGLSHACRSLKPEQGGHVCITKENMRLIFERNENDSLRKMTRLDFLAYAGRDALAVFLGACFMDVDHTWPDKAGSDQAASLRTNARQKRKHNSQPRQNTVPPRIALMNLLHPGSSRKLDSVIVPKQLRLSSLWCATINFTNLLKDQPKDVRERFEDKSSIMCQANKLKDAQDKAAKVALKRWGGLSDDGQSGPQGNNTDSDEEYESSNMDNDEYYYSDGR